MKAKLLLFGFRLAVAAALAFVCLTLTLAVTSYPTFAQAPVTYPACLQTAPQDPACLAQRFRPYLKYSKDTDSSTGNYMDEPIHPATWQWYLQQSNLISTQTNTTIHTAAELTSNPNLLISDRINCPTCDLRNQTNGQPNGQNDIGLQALLYAPDMAGVDFWDWYLTSTWKNWQGPSNWADIISGNLPGGSPIYAHVEQVAGNPDLYNVEYITLYPFNYGLADKTCRWGAQKENQPYVHYGDMTFLTLTYCKSCDQIIRATFSAHGQVLQDFDLMNDKSTGNPVPGMTFTGNVLFVGWFSLPQLTQPVQNVLTAEDDASWNDPLPAKKVSTSFWYVVPGEEVTDPTGAILDRTFYMPDVDSNNNFTGNYVYFVQDPITNRFEHIAAFVEWGSHELYPNPTGDSFCCPKHGGDGTLFLPDKVTYLGTLNDMTSNPNYAADAPFVFFNGKWGSDPQPSVMHRTWYYPDNGGYVQTSAWPACAYTDPATPFGIPNEPPTDRFVDVSPYQLGHATASSCAANPWVPWPPVTPPNTAACNMALKAFDPPTTRLTFSGPTYSNGSITFLSGSTTIGFNVTLNPVAAAKGLPGYTFIRIYAVGGVPPAWSVVYSPFPLTGYADGAYEIDYYSIDVLNNQGPIQSAQLTLDKTPPSVAITQPVQTSYPHWATLTPTYTASDGMGSGVATIAATIDGMATVGGKGLGSGQAINLDNLALGTHVFKVIATDHVGNTSTSSVTFSLITTPVDCSVVANEVLVSGQKKFKITATVTPDPPAPVFPTGTVQIWDAAFSLHVVPDPALNNGAASMMVTLAPTPTTQWIRSVFAGDTNFNGCQSPFEPARWVF